MDVIMERMDHFYISTCESRERLLKLAVCYRDENGIVIEWPTIRTQSELEIAISISDKKLLYMITDPEEMTGVYPHPDSIDEVIFTFQLSFKPNLNSFKNFPYTVKFYESDINLDISFRKLILERCHVTGWVSGEVGFIYVSGDIDIHIDKNMIVYNYDSPKLNFKFPRNSKLRFKGAGMMAVQGENGTCTVQIFESEVPIYG